MFDDKALKLDSNEARRLANELIRAADESDDHLSPMTVVDLNITVVPSIDVLKSSRDGYFCPGCGRPDMHKLCPAWGTPKYMTGELFTKEDEVTYAAERTAAIMKSKLFP